ncbi:VOC family protein [Mycobacterium sp. pUA109]|uniref:VOC family protein n=1 Tax=Mycobacterium sp. pUA109 TaxID=3238982 RepID=UPI00351B1045
MSMQTLSPADCYHIGFIVPDIEAAARRFSAASGYRWTKPVEYTLAVTTAGGDYEVPFRFVYSLQAPHLELVQEVPGTVWTAPAGAAAHHLGYWVDDIAAAAARLETAGYRLEARPSGDTLSTFAYYTDPAGVRIEIVDRALFPDWPGFLAAMAA